MQVLKSARVAWTVALAIVGGALLVGFQGGEKSAVVDLNRVIQKSQFGVKSTDDLNKQLQSRRQLLDFITTYRILTTEQAQKLRELMLKPAPTEAEKAEIERIKQDVMASDKRRQDLIQKQNITEADRQLLADYSNRAQTMLQVLDRWNGEFNDELNTLQESARSAAIERARAALSTVAKAQGFTTVFEATVAPYGANDLTDAVIKAMDAQK